MDLLDAQILDATKAQQSLADIEGQLLALTQ